MNLRSWRIVWLGSILMSCGNRSVVFVEQHDDAGGPRFVCRPEGGSCIEASLCCTKYCHDGTCAEPERVYVRDYGLRFALPQPCAKSGACAQGQCFRLTQELGLCDVPRQEVTSCTSTDPKTPDSCGCNMLVCSQGTTCVSLEPSCACDTVHQNQCVDIPCASADDCVAPDVCTPSAYVLGTDALPPNRGRCTRPLCKADAECTDGPGGRCGVIIAGRTYGEPYLDVVRCIYDGTSTAPGICQGTQAVAVDPSSYICPGLAH
jgi:hypothetical protein